MFALTVIESNVFKSLGDFLTTILPASCAVVKGQQNRLPEPIEQDFVIMNPVLRERLSTNVDGYADALFTGSIDGDTLDITEVHFGSIALRSMLFGVGMAPGTAVLALGTGSGGIGTYSVSPEQTVGPILIAAGGKTMLQPTQVTMQIDVHGPASADNAQIITTAFRDEYAVDRFAESGFDVQPLYAGDPRQVPFLNGEQQVEFRWTIDTVMQANSVLTVPQQFADAIEVGLVSVDVVYPPA
jgi:hypothetical protein